MRQRLPAVSLLAPLLAFPFSSCSEEDEPSRKGGPQDGSISRQYMLSINDTRAEVRQTCTAGSEVHWAVGPQARRCESRLLTTQDGFGFPDPFLAYWPEELTQVLVDDEHGDQAEKPELEGEGTARLVCDNIVRGDGTVRVDCDLRVAGEGFMIRCLSRRVHPHEE